MVEGTLLGPACVYIQLHVYSMYMYIFIQDIIYCIYIIYILGRTQEDRKRAQHLKNGALGALGIIGFRLAFKEMLPRY